MTVRCRVLRIAAVLLGGVLPAAAVAAPEIHVEQPIAELGTIIEGDKPSVTWLIHNRGDVDLLIERTAAGCGCTVVKMDDKDKTIPPGGARELRVDFESKGRAGMQTKYISIFSNDPKNAELKVGIRVKVDTLFAVEPAGMLNIRAVNRGQEADKTIDIHPSPGRMKLTIESVRFDTDALPVTWRAEPLSTPNGVGQRIFLKFGQTVSLGTLATVVKIRLTVDGHEREVLLPMRADVVGDITWTPVVLDATRQVLVAGRSLAEVTLRSTETAAFEVLSADAGPLFDVACEQVSGSPGRSAWTATLTLKKDAIPGPFGTLLQIRTNSLDQPVIQVPVYGSVTAPLEIEPPIVLLRADGTPLGTERLLKLQSDPNTELRVLEVSGSHAGVTAEIDLNSPRSRSQCFVRVRLTGDAGEAKGATVRLATNIPGYEKVEVPVYIDAPAAGQ